MNRECESESISSVDCGGSAGGEGGCCSKTILSSLTFCLRNHFLNAIPYSAGSFIIPEMYLFIFSSTNDFNYTEYVQIYNGFYLLLSNSLLYSVYSWYIKNIDKNKISLAVYSSVSQRLIE